MAVTDEMVEAALNRWDERPFKMIGHTDFEAMRDTLEAALSLPVSNTGEWRDISTAPKDGRAILAFNCRHMSHAPVVVVWRTDPDVELVGPEPHWADAATRYGTALYYNGNYFSHWQPLPEAPNE